MMKSFFYLFVFSAPIWAQAVSPNINSTPSREFGQPTLLPTGLNSVAPNLVEGRELNGPSSIAFDTSVSPPILYIADTFNNRILAYKSWSTLTNCGLNNPTCGFADLVIGQYNLTGTLFGGPNAPGLSIGFNQPTGIAVDAAGNLYVADTQNNRVLRFPAPFKQTSSLLTPDLVIGQPNYGGNSQNQGQNLPSAQSLSLSSNGFRMIGIAIEPSTGALWVADSGNNRVLRFPVAQLVANGQPAADLVLGQNNFTTNSLAQTPAGIPGPQFVKTILNQPLGLTFDSSDNLYVSDSYSRALYFQGSSFSSGMSATRILGIGINYSADPLPNVNQYGFAGALGLATSGNNLFVADYGNSRVVEYAVPGQWPAEPNIQSLQNGQQVSPPMLAVVGQANNFNSGFQNQNHAQASANTLALPTGLAFNGTDLWIADANNNRVVDFTQQSGSYVSATRLIGQLDYMYSAPNLIEGREVAFTGLLTGGGVAIDHNSNPPHLYIADTNNNRILCFKDARTVQASSHADMVLGQSTPTDFYDNLINSGTNLAASPTQTGLYEPIGVVVGSNGDLYVADSGNGRVLRYPSPFSQSSGSQQTPNLVLGQFGFNGPTITDATSQNMHTPWGLALLSNGSLAVSDAYDNRVLVFIRPTGGDFSNGQQAAVVLGQSGFNSTNKSTSTSGLTSPTHIAVDSSDRLYVCDTGNNRVVVFNNVPQATNGATSSFQLNNLASPQGIAITQDTGEIWVANTGNNLIYRFPLYETLILYATPDNYSSVISAEIQPQTGPIALALDDSDNLIVGEQANRLTFFFAQLTFGSLASYDNQQLAPGELAFIARGGLNFGFQQNFNLNAISPWPTSESTNDIEVLVSAPGMTPTAAPIFQVAQAYISIQVPTATPGNGTATFQVIHPSTGEIVGEGDFQMSPYAPAFWTSNQQGNGQVAAFMGGPGIDGCTTPNCNINSTGNPVPGDGNHYISLCLTGGGVFQGGPQDGVAPTGTAPTAVPPQLVSPDGFGASGLVPPADITYSGAGCGFAGGWQINFVVPPSVPPGVHTILVTLGGTPSNVGYNASKVTVTYASK